MPQCQLNNPKTVQAADITIQIVCRDMKERDIDTKTAQSNAAATEEATTTRIEKNQTWWDKIKGILSQPCNTACETTKKGTRELPALIPTNTLAELKSNQPQPRTQGLELPYYKIRKK
jgi:hypothetical protein